MATTPSGAAKIVKAADKAGWTTEAEKCGDDEFTSYVLTGECDGLRFQAAWKRRGAGRWTPDGASMLTEDHPEWHTATLLQIGALIRENAAQPDAAPPSPAFTLPPRSRPPPLRPPRLSPSRSPRLPRAASVPRLWRAVSTRPSAPEPVSWRWQPSARCTPSAGSLRGRTSYGPAGTPRRRRSRLPPPSPRQRPQRSTTPARTPAQPTRRPPDSRSRPCPPAPGRGGPDHPSSTTERHHP